MTYAMEEELRAEVVRLRQLAQKWDERAAPTLADARAKERWQCDAWIGAGGLRESALRLEDALNAMERGRLREIGNAPAGNAFKQDI